MDQALQAPGPAARIRRSRFIVCELRDVSVFDLQRFLAGSVVVQEAVRFVVPSPVSRGEVELDLGDIAVLAEIPQDWTPVGQVLEKLGASASERLGLLVQNGFVLLEDSAAASVLGIQVDDELGATNWHPLAWATQVACQRQESQFAESSAKKNYLRSLENAEEVTDAFLEAQGSPPPMFLERTAKASISLPVEASPPCVDLFSVLSRRRTTRSFEQSRSLDQARLALVLRYSFGCFGIHNVSSRFQTLHKTSPSGGSLHPIEAYPVILRVEGLRPGIYHYSVARHALSLLREFELDELTDLMVHLTQGQAFVAGAHALVLLSARLQRNFWKYRRRINTLNVVFKDAGHLSQTLQLTATAMDLGAFYTGAIHPVQTLAEFGLNPNADLPLGFCGFGVPLAPDPTWIELLPAPQVGGAAD